MLSHPAGGRPRLEEGIGHGQVAHRFGLQLAQRFARAFRLTLKDTDRVPPSQQFAGLGISQAGCWPGSKCRSWRRRIRSAASAMTVRALMPSRSSLGKPQRLDILMIELGDQKPFGRPLHRHDVG